MHLTCWRGRRGHTTLGAETRGREREAAICVCARLPSARDDGEGDGGRE